MLRKSHTNHEHLIEMADGEHDKPRKLPCDACRTRKVRCDYGLPCNRCRSYDLVCTFDYVRKKRGPKNGKGAVVEQLRAESQSACNSSSIAASQSSGTAASPSQSTSLARRDTTNGSHQHSHEGWQDPVPPVGTHTHDSSDYSNNNTNLYPISPADAFMNSDLQGPGDMTGDYLSFDEFAHSILGSSTYGQMPVQPDAPPYATTSSSAQLSDLWSTIDSGTLPPNPIQTPSFELNSITERGINLFFSHMYPIYPIVDEEKVRTSVLTPSGLMDPATGCMLLSVCAMTLVHVEQWPNMSAEQRAVHARIFIRQCQEIRMHDANFVEDASFANVLCSLFIAVTYFELKCRKASWFFVREAITLAHATGLHLASTDPSQSAAERIQRQRTYAILFVTERGAAVVDSLPVTILSPPYLSADSFLDEDPTVSRGLISLHNLFSLLDFGFVQFWNDLASLSSGAERGFPELSRLQSHLRQDPGVQGLSDIQRADVLITQQWLRLVFWQAALRLGLISSSNADPAFTYAYPLDIASSLCEIVKSLPPVAIQVHGLGIVRIDRHHRHHHHHHELSIHPSILLPIGSKE